MFFPKFFLIIVIYNKIEKNYSKCAKFQPLTSLHFTNFFLILSKIFFNVSDKINFVLSMLLLSYCLETAILLVVKEFCMGIKVFI